MRSTVTFGSPLPQGEQPRIYCYSQLEGKARVLVLPDTPEGHQDLAQLIRGEAVLRAVLGTELICTEQHVVTVRTPTGDVQDRHQVIRNYHV
jgi:hypothetical protein